jgi:hypothetical protein
LKQTREKTVLENLNASFPKEASQRNQKSILMKKKTQMWTEVERQPGMPAKATGE